MRLWSLHPQLLDQKGLVAVWREGLLAQKVLEGKTKGYRHHPQLQRFHAQPDPLEAIRAYLQAIFLEAQRRNYHFSAQKIGDFSTMPSLLVNSQQLQFEYDHLIAKLKQRDQIWMQKISKLPVKAHPIFCVIEGPVEPWEKININSNQKRK